jgi:pantoate--beta-alanine ligase
VKQSVGKVDFAEAMKSAENQLTGKGFVIDYIEMAATPDLVPLEDWPQMGPARIFIAAFLGKVRLIDNLEIIS